MSERHFQLETRTQPLI